MLVQDQQGRSTRGQAPIRSDGLCSQATAG
jgi:hypothetical protein